MIIHYHSTPDPKYNTRRVLKERRAYSFILILMSKLPIGVSLVYTILPYNEFNFCEIVFASSPSTLQ